LEHSYEVVYELALFVEGFLVWNVVGVFAFSYDLVGVFASPVAEAFDASYVDIASA